MKKNDGLIYYLQLLEVFTVREIKYRYRASILGPLWIVINPLATTAILSIILGIFVKIEMGKTPYFLFLFSGLTFWNFFQQSVSLASETLIWNRDLITKTNFERNVLPLSYVLSKIPDLAIGFLIFFLFYLSYGFRPPTSILLVLLTIPPLFMFTSGVSLILSLLNSFFRDFGRIFEVLIMVFSYATPIIYSDSLIPERFKFFIYVNPLASIIIFSRRILFEGQVNFGLLGAAYILSLFMMVLGLYIFRKLEKKIADFI